MMSPFRIFPEARLRFPTATTRTPSTSGAIRLARRTSSLSASTERPPTVRSAFPDSISRLSFSSALTSSSSRVKLIVVVRFLRLRIYSIGTPSSIGASATARYKTRVSPISRAPSFKMRSPFCRPALSAGPSSLTKLIKAPCASSRP